MRMASPSDSFRAAASVLEIQSRGSTLCLASVGSA
jgi:hypothetical protein